MNGVRIDKTVTAADAAAAMKVLMDNGVEPDECGTVLQAVGYALCGAELMPVVDEATKDKTTEITNALCAAMPKTIAGCSVDAELYVPGCIRVLLGADEYEIAVKRAE